jgi:hypothetical protein
MVGLRTFPGMRFLGFYQLSVAFSSYNSVRPFEANRPLIKLEGYQST